MYGCSLPKTFAANIWNLIMTMLKGSLTFYTALPRFGTQADTLRQTPPKQVFYGVQYLNIWSHDTI